MLPIICDGVLPPAEADAVEQALTSPEIPWLFYANVNYAFPPPEGRPGVFQNDGRFRDSSGFSSLIFPNPQPNAAGFGQARLVLERFLNEHGVRPNRLIRIKANLLTRVPADTRLPFTPHVDLPAPHFALIYYVNDSDGDTLLFDKTYPEWQNATIAHAVSPKKGRAVLFDGRHYHCGACPAEHDFRIVLNFNFV